MGWRRFYLALAVCCGVGIIHVFVGWVVGGLFGLDFGAGGLYLVYGFGVDCCYLVGKAGECGFGWIWWFSGVA